MVKIISKNTKSSYFLIGYIIFTALSKKVVFIRKNIRLLFVFVLPVYIYIVQSSIQNKHTHFYPNGIVITHSHPVDTETDRPISDHEHSKTEICLFQQLKINSLITSAEWTIESGEFYVVQKFVVVADENYKCTLFRQPQKRGPPIHSQQKLNAV